MLKDYRIRIQEKAEEPGRVKSYVVCWPQVSLEVDGDWLIVRGYDGEIEAVYNRQRIVYCDVKQT